MPWLTQFPFHSCLQQTCLTSRLPPPGSLPGRSPPQLFLYGFFLRHVHSTNNTSVYRFHTRCDFLCSLRFHQGPCHISITLYAQRGPESTDCMGQDQPWLETGWKRTQGPKASPSLLPGATAQLKAVWVDQKGNSQCKAQRSQALSVRCGRTSPC